MSGTVPPDDRHDLVPIHRIVSSRIVVVHLFDVVLSHQSLPTIHGIKERLLGRTLVELTRYGLAVCFHEEESAFDRITTHDCSLSESCLVQGIRCPVATYGYGEGHVRAHD